MTGLLAQLDLLAEKATPRPWIASGPNDRSFRGDDPQTYRAWVWAAPGSVVIGDFFEQANAALAVAAVNAYPALRRVIEAAREYIHALDQEEIEANPVNAALDLSGKAERRLRKRLAALEDETER